MQSEESLLLETCELTRKPSRSCDSSGGSKEQVCERLRCRDGLHKSAVNLLAGQRHVVERVSEVFLGMPDVSGTPYRKSSNTDLNVPWCGQGSWCIQRRSTP